MCIRDKHIKETLFLLLSIYFKWTYLFKCINIKLFNILVKNNYQIFLLNRIYFGYIKAVYFTKSTVN